MTRIEQLTAVHLNLELNTCLGSASNTLTPLQTPVQLSLPDSGKSGSELMNSSIGLQRSPLAAAARCSSVETLGSLRDSFDQGPASLQHPDLMTYAHGGSSSPCTRSITCICDLRVYMSALDVSNRSMNTPPHSYGQFLCQDLVFCGPDSGRRINFKGRKSTRNRGNSQRARCWRCPGTGEHLGMGHLKLGVSARARSTTSRPRASSSTRSSSTSTR